MDFSGEGDLLASVGGHPDFMLTVWDWRKESIVLRYKAFSQDVFRVSFSPENPGQLTTSGTGHIRYIHLIETLYITNIPMSLHSKTQGACVFAGSGRWPPPSQD